MKHGTSKDCGSIMARHSSMTSSSDTGTGVAHVSHERRTPLNAILGFAQLMETGVPAPTPSQRRNLDQIRRAAR